MKIQPVLIRAKEILIEKGWTKGAPARTLDGEFTHSANPEAVCFCLYGSIWKAMEELHPEKAKYTVTDQIDTDDTLVEFNDSQESVEPVLAKMDELIAQYEDN